MSFGLTIEQGHQINGNQLNGHELHLKNGIDMSKLVGVPHLFGRYIDTRNGFLNMNNSSASKMRCPVNF